jgi:site-specific DNA recombinase
MASGNATTSAISCADGWRAEGYRYYVSRPLITKVRTEGSSGMRIPAAEIEQLVTSRLRRWLVDPDSVYAAIPLLDLSARRRLVERAAEIGKSWGKLPAARQRSLLTTLIERINVAATQIDIHFRPTRLGGLRDLAAIPSPNAIEGETQILTVPVQLRRSGREIKMLIDGTDPFATVKPNPRLIKLLIRAHRFNAILACGDGVPFAALARREGVSPSYFTRLVRLSYLAPDITQAILNGRQPPDLTPDKLLAHSRLPLAWHEQRTVLGFA